jgi:aryl-alcohol dehydrogenase-like predicted oxidoreductase
MQYKRLGASGLQVSELAFGTMSFGDTVDEATANPPPATDRDEEGSGARLQLGHREATERSRGFGGRDER